MSQRISDLLIENTDEDGAISLDPRLAGLILTWVERHERLWLESVTVHEALKRMTDKVLVAKEPPGGEG